MELGDILKQRRMVRSYRPDPVPREVIERIVATVRRAPSGGFSQGHRLVVVTDPPKRRALARLAGEAEYVAAGGQAWISTAPVHVFVGTREESYHERYRKPDKLRDGEEIGWPAPYCTSTRAQRSSSSSSRRSTRDSRPASSASCPSRCRP
jgi:nitroreductase